MKDFEKLEDGELVEVNGGAYNQTCFVYVIKAGDNLTKIAQKYNTTIKELCILNNITNPDLIYAGEKLLVPYKN